MLKKAYYSFIFALITTTALIAIERIELQNAVQAVKRAYQKEVIKLKKMELLNPDIYAKATPIITKIIDSASFKEKMVASITEQYNAIVEQNTPFTAIKQETSLTDFLPNATTNRYLQILYKFMANKAYCQLLWQKLFSKEKQTATETNTETATANPTETTSPEAVTNPNPEQ